MSTPIRLADVFRSAFPDYVRRYGPLPPHYYKAANAIMACRTPLLGAHEYHCDNCKSVQLHYHSCRNRHCPRCQAYASNRWVQARADEMLPVGYFHAVFTLPAQLNAFALRNKAQFYAILYRSVAETLQTLAQESPWLNALIGFTALLHTWGQNLMDHPHLHCMIPAGGIHKKGRRWKACNASFLFPVPVVQALFRGKFLAFFKAALEDGSIKLHGQLQRYQSGEEMKKLFDTLYRKQWVVFIKKPFTSPLALVNYLGNYTHRIAISERRIQAFDGTNVTFSYTDYADNNSRKSMTLSAVEFIRRFMLHILPQGFMRIRHYGFFANRYRKARLALCRKLLGQKEQPPRPKQLWYEFIMERTGHHPLLCPHCGVSLLVPAGFVAPQRPGG
jgi:hypothetical protein